MQYYCILYDIACLNSEKSTGCQLSLFMIFYPSHYLIVVSSESLVDTEDIEDIKLLPIGQDNDHPYYVTASVTYNRSLPLFIIGSGSDTIDPVSGRHFYNAPLHKEQTYYYFIRAYSAAHTSQVGASFCVVE